MAARLGCAWVSVAVVVPSMLAVMVEVFVRTRVGVVVAGVYVPVVRGVGADGGGVGDRGVAAEVVCNQYGPTETTIYSTRRWCRIR